MEISFQEKLRNQKVLITGGLGFVGSNLAKFIVANSNAEVTIVDDFTNSSLSAIDEIKSKISFIEMSVLDKDLYPTLKSYNYIFHLACIQIAASSNNPILDMEVNSLSTLNMLEELRKDIGEVKKFIYTSSGSVYGSSTRLPLQENSRTSPLSNYAATKLLGENYTLIYGRNYHLPVVCVRYSNVYGQGQTPNNPYCGVLGKFIHNACLGKSLTVIGDGEQTRDYTFIDDAVEATSLAAIHPFALNDVYNISTNTETSVNKLAVIIKEHFPSITIENIPERDIDNIRRRSLDIEKIHQRLGWTPKTNITKGIAKTINWYKSYLDING